MMDNVGFSWINFSLYKVKFIVIYYTYKGLRSIHIALASMLLELHYALTSMYINISHSVVTKH